MAERTPYSPGPLSWRENDGHYNIENVLGTVAVAFGESTRNGAKTGVIGDEGEGNARLFAAAPDLLAACIELDETLKIFVEAPALDRMLKNVRAAIAKAVARG